ncbi:hypothetical protein [Sphingorhabdus sp. Alg239-R122]|uniref:hypothetical protein n=1 Tax=Sphingorhabdus sp. Alg239-R122 TaxID=2305989 RepID=UPI0013D919AF|nr:hypothetical protein [Sphingorhabdus sp. Alg239-R122]
MKKIAQSVAFGMAAAMAVLPVAAHAETYIECDQFGNCVVITCEVLPNGQEVCFPSEWETPGIPD